MLVLQLVFMTCAVAPFRVAAQAVAHPVMHGKVFVGSKPLTKGLVVLHHLSPAHQGPVDSVHLGRSGTFTFHLPTVPDSARHDLYFAAIEHDGVLYFGTPIGLPIQLDSLYQIHTYDTTMVASAGVTLPIQTRDVFIEKDSTGKGWSVTDLFEVQNQKDRTLTARKDGIVWRYPLPSRGSSFQMGQTGFSLDAASFRGDTIIVRAPIPPGSRAFVVRYTVPDPFFSIPAPGSTATMEMLVREPAPHLTVSGLQSLENVQLEPGSTYRHFLGKNVQDAVITLEKAAAPKAPPVRWIAVILALVLTGFGLRALYGSRLASAGGPSGRMPDPLPGPPRGRQEIILEIARLDESFDALDDPSDEQRESYEARRTALLRGLRE